MGEYIVRHLLSCTLEPGLELSTKTHSRTIFYRYLLILLKLIIHKFELIKLKSEITIY